VVAVVGAVVAVVDSVGAGVEIGRPALVLPVDEHAVNSRPTPTAAAAALALRIRAAYAAGWRWTGGRRRYAPADAGPGRHVSDDYTRREILHGIVIAGGAAALGACSAATTTTPPTTGPNGSAGPAATTAGTTAGTTAVGDATVTPSGAPILLGVPVTGTRLPPGTRPDPTRPEGTDLLPDIEHIVVLMMENHSYDNYFGMFDRGDGFTVVDGKPTDANPDKDGTPVVAHHLPSTSQHDFHITQAWVSSHRQFNDGKLDGFVVTSGKEAMGYWTGDDIPFYWSLAKTFPLCDRFFCSVLAQTYPNRRYLTGATSLGNITTELSSTFPSPANGTIFDLLEKHQISWMNYHAGAPELALFPTAFFAYNEKHVAKIPQFLDDAKAGKLPAVSYITPHPNVSEENPQDISQGESFAAGIINAVMASPNWAKTVMVLTYDEHGGYYDHVVPPKAFAPDDIPPDATRTGGVPGGFDQLGFRVPTIIISPFAKADYVSHVTHDLTSILRLIETKWNLGALTYRDANASNLLDALDFASPPAFATPPKLADSRRPANPIQVPPAGGDE